MSILIFQGDGQSKTLHPTLKKEIRRLIVEDRIVKSRLIQQNLKTFVEMKVDPTPNKTDTAFYPKLNSIKCHKLRILKELKKSEEGQGLVTQLVNNFCYSS